MPRVADYVRQSVRRESGSEASPATQRAANERRAGEIADAVWVGRFADIGISGYKDVERPDFDKLCALVASGGVDIVIVHYMSRLTRKDVKLSLPLLMGWLAAGVTIISVNEGVYRNDNIGDLISLIISLDRGHRESDNKSKAVRGAKAIALSLGGYIGKPGLGFTLTPEVVTNPADGKPILIRRLMPDSVEAPVVLRMVTDAEDGATDHRVAADLNRDEIPTRGQTTAKRTARSAWDAQTIARVLRDPRIAGIAVTLEYGTRPDGRPSTTVANYRIERDSLGQPVISHPGIITPERWFALQSRRRAGDAVPGPKRPPRASLLTCLNMLFCECGSKMKATPGAHGYAYYRCYRPTGKKPGPGEHTGDCTISQLALDRWVADQLFDIIGRAEPSEHEQDETLTGILVEASRRFASSNADPNSAGQRAALAADLASAQADLDDHLAVIGAWRNRRNEWQARADALNAAVENLSAAIEEHDATQSPDLLTFDAWLGDSDTGPLGEGSWWHTAKLADKRALVSIFVERITVFKSGKPYAGKAKLGVDGRNSKGRLVGKPRAEIRWVGTSLTDEPS